MNCKLHAVCNEDGKPIVMLLTTGQMSDHKGARMMLPVLPPATALLGDRGDDSKWFRAKGITPCNPVLKEPQKRHPA